MEILMDNLKQVFFMYCLNKAMFLIQDENKDSRKILLEKDEKGQTSFFLAAQNNQREIVEVLQKNGINQEPDNNKDHQARTPLMVALEHGNDKVVTELCQHLRDEEMTKRDIDDNNIFHFACISEHPCKMMTILLNALTKNTADNASTRQDMFSDLLCEGNINQETPLHILASKGRVF
jgi:ankyrin repeat protein